MNKNIRNLQNISSKINKLLLDKDNNITKRNRNNNIIDAILYKLYYTKYGSTQEKATIMLNKYKKINVSRQSLVKKEKNLTYEVYNQVANILSNENNQICKPKYTKQIIAVDGTYPTFLKSLSKDGFKSNKNKESVTPLITGLFNITVNYPVILELAKDKNERKSFMNFIKNKSEYEDNIFVFDRGYDGNNLFKFMEDNDLLYVCRIKDNRLCIPDKDDDFITLDNGIKVRIIKFVIDNQSYHVATNVYDYSINLIKQIYHDRWSIEEYFKYIKQNMKLAKINEQRLIDIQKTIIAHLIVSQIAFTFANFNKKNNIKDKIVNKSILTEGIYDDFLFKFFNNLKFTKYFLTNFIATYVKYIQTNRNKSCPHTCKRSNFRWFFKKYFKNMKSVNV